MSIGDRERLRELLQLHKRRLHILQKQAARYGADTPPHIQIEIEDIQTSIDHLEQDQAKLQQQSQAPPSTTPTPTSAFREPPPLRRLRVFLCHASDDKAATRELYRRLSKDGFQPWLDEEDLLPGHHWEHEISKAVEVSDVVLICLSKRSINKRGYIQKEIKYALDVAQKQPKGTVYIIPVRLEECLVPNLLKQWQWVNLFGNEEEGYRRLVRALNNRAAGIALMGTYQPTNASQSHSQTTIHPPIVLKPKETQPIHIWRLWEDYPPYVFWGVFVGLIGTIIALIAIFSFISNRPSIPVSDIATTLIVNTTTRPAQIAVASNPNPTGNAATIKTL